MSSSTPNKSNRGATSQDSDQHLLSLSGGNDHGQQQQHESDGVAAAAPSPSILQQWADLVASPPDWISQSLCSGCLTQVEGEDYHTTINQDDNVKGRAVGASQGSDGNTLDHDGSTEEPSRGASRVGNEDQRIEISTIKDCPICLIAMSHVDTLYPIKCPAACKYNFCLNCMTSLLQASKEDYQVASDGSRSVKVRLQCPNCRSDISDIIEEVILLRQEAFAAGMETSAKKMPHDALTVPPTSKIHEDCLNISSVTASTSRLKNRSCAPRHVHLKRVNELIDKIQSMPTPSSARDQVLAAHDWQQQKDSFSSGSLISKAYSQSYDSSSSSVEAQVDQPLSPISSKHSVSSTATASEVAPPTPFASPSASRQYNRLSSDRSRFGTPPAIRRTQSFQTPSTRPNPGSKKKSPRSVLDLAELFAASDDGISPQNDETKRSPEKMAEGSKVSLEGVNFSDDNGFFSNAIDLGWCCYDSTTKEGIDRQSSSVQMESPSRNIKVGEGCGGYIDYGGIYHPCTQGGQNRGFEWDGPCQGCIFLQGMYDGGNSNSSKEEDNEELYYDSDPGQHFCDTWSQEDPPPPPSSCGELDIMEQGSIQLSVSEISETAGERAKLRWRRRKKRNRKPKTRGHSAPRRVGSNAKDACTAYLQVVQQKQEEEEELRQRQEDQQAYIYDYFSQKDDDNNMQTGFCSTKEMDLGNSVQEAINSKWTLQWHVDITGSSKSRNESKLCEVWIERGYRRNRTEIVEPKLMWRELSQPDLSMKRQLGGSTIRPYRVSLFAIRRIYPVSNGVEGWQEMNLGSNHPQTQAILPPLAKQNCLLLVRSSLGSDYVFEASCPEERDHIVHLLKIATARLVSHAVAGNGDGMVREFFNEDMTEGGLYASLITTNDG